jgi:hypothetical protein
MRPVHLSCPIIRGLFKHQAALDCGALASSGYLLGRFGERPYLVKASGSWPLQFVLIRVIRGLFKHQAAFFGRFSDRPYSGASGERPYIPHPWKDKESFKKENKPIFFLTRKPLLLSCHQILLV